MTPQDQERAAALKASILRYHANVAAMPGLSDDAHVDALVAQFIDSLRRVEFAHHIRDAQLSESRTDPSTELFDPLRAAVLHNRRGRVDEAWWLVFLATHFGKHHIDGWRLVRDVYGRLGAGGLWDWTAISVRPAAFRIWLAANEATLRGGDGQTRRFSNHRKYESLRAGSAKGTANVIATYVDWVSPPRGHADLVRDIHAQVGQDPEAVFAALYNSMAVVSRFGRLGRFDFLAMLGKLGIAPVSPGSTYLANATGPLAGARLLFGGATDAAIAASTLETRLVSFGQATGLGSQVLEDAICNWQKSPDRHVRFRG